MVVAILHASSYERIAWKNGGGVTDLVATAAADPASWRVSIASIECDGPFSDFSGYDRTIVSLSGSGVTLAFSSGEERSLATLEPFAFPGETRVDARLTGGPVRDFNVMTLRATHAHRVTAIAFGENGVPIDAGDVCGFLYVATGTVAIDEITAVAGDTFRLDAGARTVARSIAGPATAILVRLSAATN